MGDFQYIKPCIGEYRYSLELGNIIFIIKLCFCKCTGGLSYNLHASIYSNEVKNKAQLQHNRFKTFYSDD